MFCLKRGNFIHSFAWEFSSFVGWKLQNFPCFPVENRIRLYIFEQRVRCTVLKHFSSICWSSSAFSIAVACEFCIFRSAQTWTSFAHSFSPRVRSCARKRSENQRIARHLEPLRKDGQFSLRGSSENLQNLPNRRMPWNHSWFENGLVSQAPQQ